MLKVNKILYYSFYIFKTSIMSPIYWIVIIIIFFQYKKLGHEEKIVLGSLREPLYKRVIDSSLMGLLGGIIASIIFMFLETTIVLKDYIYILPLALILSLIHPRFICFSYAGGIVSLVSLLFRYPTINTSSVMTTIAVLHLIESFLISVDGHNSKIPMFMENDGIIVGGFSMKRFWAIPFLLLKDTKTFYPLPIVAILGYSDLALTRYAETKTKETAGLLFLFSIILLILAQLSNISIIFKYISSVFSPICHEILIHMGERIEKKRKPVFLPSLRGLKVLDTIPGGIGETIGIKSGDIILCINGQEINSEEILGEVLDKEPKYIWLDIFIRENKLITKEYEDYKKGIRDLGLIVIPKDMNCFFVAEEMKIFIKKLRK